MTIHVHISSMNAAEQLSVICKEFDHALLLRSEKICVDPKSTLGVLAMMYSARDTMYLDTNGMDEAALPGFLRAIDEYIVKEEA